MNGGSRHLTRRKRQYMKNYTSNWDFREQIRSTYLQLQNPVINTAKNINKTKPRHIPFIACLKNLQTMVYRSLARYDPKRSNNFLDTACTEHILSPRCLLQYYQKYCYCNNDNGFERL